MNILFDYQAFELQTYGGVSRMFVELASRLNSMGNQCLIGVKESSNIHLQESNLVEGLKPAHYRHDRVFGQKQSFKGEYRIKESLIRLAGYSIQPNHDYCKQLLRQQRFDVFHPTYFDSYFLDYLKEKPFVLTVHDMIPEKFPQYFPRDDFQIIKRKVLCPLASRIHVPSNNTKKDLVYLLNISPEKVHVIPHGYSAPLPIAKEQTLAMEKPYILYVGLRHLYKNFVPFIKECAKVLRDAPDLEVVCTGPSFTDAEQQLFGELNIASRVKHVYANESELALLYRNAVTFVYPSEYEGFGLPILEAFANDCPVMLNDASCFPEVADDAAIYFTFEHSDFYDKFFWLYRLSDEDRKQLIEKGRERLSIYSWEQSAKEMMQLYQSIL